MPLPVPAQIPATHQGDVRVTSPWRVYRGHVHQLQQSSMAGELLVGFRSTSAVPLLDTVLGAQLQTKLPDEISRCPDDGLALVQRIAFWIVEWQRQCRIPLSSRYHVERLDSSELTDGTGRYLLTLPVAHMAASKIALQGVLGLVNQLTLGALSSQLPNSLDKISNRVTELSQQIRKLAPTSFNMMHMMDAAFRLDIPVIPLDAMDWMYGTGSHGHILHSTITDQTPFIGVNLARDKMRTAQTLRRIGLPGAEHQLVESSDAAVAQAQRYGYPVVIKPADLDQGQGVAANLRSEASVRAAFQAASQLSKRVLLERHFDGFGHRLTLFRDELIMVLKRIPGGVQGDGVRSVAELVAARTQETPRAGNINLGRVTLDTEALSMLQENGLGPDSVPAAGAFVILRRRDNISAGGTLLHLDPDDVHPDNLDLARRVARAVQLDLAGVDLLIPDIGTSWLASGALVCEVNGMPQLGAGLQGDNYIRLLQALLGPRVRIPTTLYWCLDSLAPDLPQRLQHEAQKLGMHTVACRQGIWRAGSRAGLAFASSYSAALGALTDRDTQSLLFAITPEEVLQTGIPVNQVDQLLAENLEPWSPAQRDSLRDAMLLIGAEPSASPA